MRESPGNLLYVSFDHVVGLFLVDGIGRWQTQLFVQLLHTGYLLWIYKRRNDVSWVLRLMSSNELTTGTIALLHELLLLVGSALHCHDGQPSALSFLDVGTDLTSNGRITEAIQEIILSLIEQANLQQNGFGLAKHFRIGETGEERKT